MEPILFSGNTHPGLRRPANQDACIIQPLWSSAGKVLAVVIDGVGGYAGGERAAAIAKDCIEQYMQAPSGDILTMLREAVIFANNRIAAERKNDQRFSEMCCVLTALVADTPAQNIYFVHVGDTRLYRYRCGILQKLTRDHSLVGIREDAGDISEREAMAHPHRNQILREVGSALHRLDDEDFMDYGKGSLEAGDILLLCSDGLTDMIDSAQLTSVLAGSLPLTGKTDRLIELANAAGGHDNITVVLLQCPNAVAAGLVESDAARTKDAETPAAAKTPTHHKKNTRWQTPVRTTAFLLLLLIAGAGWYFTKPEHLVAEARHLAVVPAAPGSRIQPDSNAAKPAGRSSHPAVQGPVTPAKADTLRISSTQDFADLKKYTDSGKSLVLLPENAARNRFSAITITVRSAQAGDTLLVSKIHLVGFENGIDIQQPIVLKTTDLIFENVHQPFRYLLKPGEKHTSILVMNNVKQ